jgi:hypothetical protein
MSYQDSRMPVVHDVVPEPRTRSCHPAPAESLIETEDAIREVDP